MLLIIGLPILVRQTLKQMRSIIPLLLLAGFGISLQAQDADAIQKILQKTNVDKLQELAREWRIRDSIQGAEAVAKALEEGWPLRIEEEEHIAELVRLDANGNPLYYYTGNDTAAISTQTDQLHSGGGSGYNLEGNGMTVGEWDGGGVRTSHEQLTGRVTQQDNLSGLSDHATHVAGTLIGDGTPVASAKGMAPQANLDAYDWNSDISEMTNAAANGLLISNHSYGYITGWRGSGEWWGTQFESEAYAFGIYNGAAIDWDNVAYNAPHYLICKSAGNDRNDVTPPVGTQWELNGNTDTLYTYDPTNHPESSPEADGGTDGYDCISWMGNAKNILTIGAVNDVSSYSGPGSVSMSSFSGWGPTDDGRIKPDIVGNGTGLYSSLSGSDSEYASYWGTSMSSPNVAGSLLLLQEHYMNTHNNTAMLSATLKALAIHSARECGSADGPDYEYGWGLLSVKDAADLIAEDVSKDSTIAELTLNDGGTYTYDFSSDGTEPLRATICWTDPPGGSSGITLDDPTPKLINDLDLRISKDGTDYEPYVMNPSLPSNPATTGDNTLDNVEQVYIASPAAGMYTLTVTHKGSLSNPQDFSLIVSGQDNALLPVEFIAVEGNAEARYNQISCQLYEEHMERIELQAWNGSRFEYLDKQYSDGHSQLSSYTFKDDQFTKASNYLYRFKAIDRDGSYDYSPVVNIIRNNESDQFTIYPNPVEGQIYFQGLKGARELKLLSQDGKLIRTWSTQLPASYDTQLLPEGTYYWIVNKGQQELARKMVKK
jgi:hypothetical protein